jgi:hypothetical protein
MDVGAMTCQLALQKNIYLKNNQPNWSKKFYAPPTV